MDRKIGMLVADLLDSMSCKIGWEHFADCNEEGPNHTNNHREEVQAGVAEDILAAR